MPIEKASSASGIALNGQITNPRKVIFSHNIPVSIYASDEGLTFKIFDGPVSSRFFPYDKLNSISTRNFLWKKSVSIYSNTGIETIRCSESRETIFEFCEAVERRIAATRRKSFAARFNLTRLEAPPDQKYQRPEQAVEGYDFVIDSLFDPEKMVESIFDKLDQEVALVANDVSSIPTRIPQKITKTRELSAQSTYDLFGKRHASQSNIYLTRAHFKKLFLVLAIIALGIVAAWELGELSGTGFDRFTFKTAQTPEPPPEPKPPTELIDQDTGPRALERLVEIVHDNEKYRSLVDLLTQKRMGLGLSTEDMSARIGWTELKINNMESKLYRATSIEVLDYSLALKEDIHDIMDDFE